MLIAYKLISWIYSRLLICSTVVNNWWLALAGRLIKNGHELKDIPRVNELFNLPYYQTVPQGSIFYIKSYNGYVELTGDKWMFIDPKSQVHNNSLYGQPIDPNDFIEIGTIIMEDDPNNLQIIKK